MDQIKELKQRYLNEDIFPNHLGIELLELSSGFARMKMQVTEQMVNFHGITHGGATFTLADTAFGLASNSHGATAVALQASINYVSPAQPGEVLEAVAYEESLTRSTGVYHVRIEKENGSQVALFRGVVYRK